MGISKSQKYAINYKKLCAVQFKWSIFLNKIIVLPELNNENIKDILKFNWENMAMYF